MDNPYRSPMSDALAIPVDEPLREYGGIGRLAYVGYSFLAGIVMNVLAAAAAATEAAPALFGVVVVAAFAATIFITVQRLKNLGYSGWWSILMFVPLANILVGLRCLICPMGYADTKKLDKAGKIVSGVVVALFILAVVMPLLLLALSNR